MANGWNTESDREAMLRRVAIVLTSLPAPLSSQLMGALGEDSKRAVQRTMTTLSDVDPLERKRALQAFRVSVQHQPGWKPPSTAGQDAAEGPTHATSNTGPASRLVSSGGAKHVSGDHDASTGVTAGPQSSGYRTPQGDHSPLSFLGDIDDDTLMRMLAIEHPQAVALVLASIAPAQAARILPRLESRLRNETLSRLGRLGEVPEAAAAEVAEHFRSRLANVGGESNTGGRRALDAILAAMPTPLNIHVPREADSKNEDTPAADRHASQAASTSVSPLSFPSADLAAMDLTHKLRAAEQDSPDSPVDRAEKPSMASQPLPATSQTPTEATAADEPESPTADGRELNIDQALTDSVHSSPQSIFHSTDAIHQYLVQLAPEELCRALGKVATRDAILALCGLPNHVTESALAVLPRARAKQVRSSMNALGSLQLREIDDAKERVARASVAMQEQAVGQLPLAA